MASHLPRPPPTTTSAGIPILPSLLPSRRRNFQDSFSSASGNKSEEDYEWGTPSHHQQQQQPQEHQKDGNGTRHAILDNEDPQIDPQMPDLTSETSSTKSFEHGDGMDAPTNRTKSSRKSTAFDPFHEDDENDTTMQESTIHTQTTAQHFSASDAAAWQSFQPITPPIRQQQTAAYIPRTLLTSPYAERRKKAKPPTVGGAQIHVHSDHHRTPFASPRTAKRKILLEQRKGRSSRNVVYPAAPSKPHNSTRSTSHHHRRSGSRTKTTSTRSSSRPRQKSSSSTHRTAPGHRVQQLRQEMARTASPRATARRHVVLPDPTRRPRSASPTTKKKVVLTGRRSSMGHVATEDRVSDNIRSSSQHRRNHDGKKRHSTSSSGGHHRSSSHRASSSNGSRKRRERSSSSSSNRHRHRSRGSSSQRGSRGSGRRDRGRSSSSKSSRRSNQNDNRSSGSRRPRVHSSSPTSSSRHKTRTIQPRLVRSSSPRKQKLVLPEDMTPSERSRERILGLPQIPGPLPLTTSQHSGPSTIAGESRSSGSRRSHTIRLVSQRDAAESSSSSSTRRRTSRPTTQGQPSRRNSQTSTTSSSQQQQQHYHTSTRSKSAPSKPAHRPKRGFVESLDWNQFSSSAHRRSMEADEHVQRARREALEKQKRRLQSLDLATDESSSEDSFANDETPHMAGRLHRWNQHQVPSKRVQHRNGPSEYSDQKLYVSSTTAFTASTSISSGWSGNHQGDRPHRAGRPKRAPRRQSMPDM